MRSHTGGAAFSSRTLWHVTYTTNLIRAPEYSIIYFCSLHLTLSSPQKCRNYRLWTLIKIRKWEIISLVIIGLISHDQISCIISCSRILWMCFYSITHSLEVSVSCMLFAISVMSVLWTTQHVCRKSRQNQQCMAGFDWNCQNPTRSSQ